jgi:deazaflavin-dependent oxidoreductase (nitroreductase family)
MSDNDTDVIPGSFHEERMAELRAEHGPPGSFHGKVIAEFRANHGRVGGMFQSASIVLVHHTGRNTGMDYVSPLIYYKLDSGWAVFATNAGSPTHPQWYRNLVAHPRTTIEVGDDRLDVVARVAEGDERTRIRDEWERILPLVGEYERQAAPRQVPVVVFEPIA